MTMTFVRLPEGGRAALSFPVEGAEPRHWAAAQREAFQQGSRRNILRNWAQLPQWVRRDQGFCRLMDEYHPVDEETLDLQMRLFPHLYQTGTQLNPAVPIGHPELRGVDLDEEEVIRALKHIPLHRAVMDFGITFGGGTAIATNSTTRTVVGAKCAANQAIRVWGIDIGFDGTTSTNGPAIVELDTNTWATNAPGTNSTSVTPNPNDSGRPETIQTSCAKAWTTEPTVLSPVELMFIPSYMGAGVIFTPLTKPFVAKGGNGASMRVTQQSGVTANATGTEKCEE